MSALLSFLLLLGPTAAAAAGPTIVVSPIVATVGSPITITGTGFPPNVSINLRWTTSNASWLIKAIPTPQVTGVTNVPFERTLGSAQTDASGSFMFQMMVPSEYGGVHAIQAFGSDGNAFTPTAAFTLEPHFQISPMSGPAGAPMRVVATGLGIGIYSASYHLYWDNTYVGYMTALSLGGATNFTFYASGEPGVHYVSIYEGYPGPGVFNPSQGNSKSPLAASVYWPPDVPFFANFTVTPQQVVSQPTSSTTAAAFTRGPAEAGALALVAVVLIGGGLFVSRMEPERRKAISKVVVAVAIIALVAVAGVGVYVASTNSSSTSATMTSSYQGSSTSQLSPGPKVTFTPAATVVRPHIEVPQSGATTGPRISTSPNIASIGENITVNGLGFTPSAQLPITWSTRHGSNILGYKILNLPLRNVTAGADGAFSFTMKVPPDLGGIHYIAAGNLTQRSNATFFLQRTASLSATHGPQGTQFQIILQGIGWDFNTNIATFDYDNSYVGYGCGFSSGGNVTFTVVATGPPGIHTIDVYPSVWWGSSTFANQQVVEYRYPLLTPQDHPELMPSFHFTFLVTP